ncbi:ribonuclease H-like domain-containing protein [Tanacetum coccineum]
MGLDDVYTPIRSQILTTEPLPDVKSAFATLSRDKSHRISHSQASGSKNGQVIFVARTNDWNNDKNSVQTSQNRRFVNLVCKHCHMIGHTIDKCFEIVGYPNGFKKMSVNGSKPGDAQVNEAGTYALGIMSKCLWHNMLDHPSDQVIEVLKRKLNIDEFSTSDPCEVCHKAKDTRGPFPLSDHKYVHLGKLVHLDV